MHGGGGGAGAGRREEEVRVRQWLVERKAQRMLERYDRDGNGVLDADEQAALRGRLTSRRRQTQSMHERYIKQLDAQLQHAEVGPRARLHTCMRGEGRRYQCHLNEVRCAVTSRACMVSLASQMAGQVGGSGEAGTVGAQNALRNWREAWDPHWSRVYYWNKLSGEVRWTLPGDRRQSQQQAVSKEAREWSSQRMMQTSSASLTTSYVVYSSSDDDEDSHPYAHERAYVDEFAALDRNRDGVLSRAEFDSYW